ncbi:oligosaccharide flippase family protein, partial [uncultured Ruminococcus sp.]|uniref:oligosaccharide flippase family protein n=1 Tax=uncultured Ruminococcus sp. TaxID=165186 RepID=UPI0025FF09A2
MKEKRKMNKSGTSKTLVKNTVMLYIMNITKIVLPLVTLPYLTRVLSKDCYGVVSYVKAVMQYMQVVVDFGFILSATKDVVNCKEDKKKLSYIIGDTMFAKLILVLVSFVALVIMIYAIPILRRHAFYTILSFVVVAMTCFLMDFLFRGLEEMHIITIRYVLMRSIAALLTFVFVKNDTDMIWIPILDIIGTSVAIILVFFEMRKRDIKICFTGIKSALIKLKESAIFFLSNMATTTFTALNTLLIGIYVDAAQVAEWSVCLQMVSAVMSMYTPITDGIYPHMVKSKDWKLVTKTAKILENTKTVRENYISKLSDQEKSIQEKIDEYNTRFAEINAEILAIARDGIDTQYIGGELAWPVPGYTRISSKYGMRTHPITGVYKLHTGVDISAPLGANFIAANDGIVTKAGYNSAYGNMVIIDHGGGVSTLYAHGSEILVQVGQVVKRGESILKVGSTGYSTGPHAHFEVRLNGVVTDP